MRRLSVAGLAIVVVFALGATFALSAEAKKGRIIVGPWKTTSTTGPTELEAPLLGKTRKVACSGGQSTGEVQKPNEALGTTVFNGCQMSIRECQSAGEASGFIKTEEKLKYTLGWINKAQGKVGEDVTSPVTDLAQFECEGVTVTWRGSVIGVVEPVDQMTSESNVHFAYESSGLEGKQIPEKFEGAAADTPLVELSSTGTFSFPGLWKATETVKSAELEAEGKNEEIVKTPDPTEINTFYSPEHPVFGRCQPLKKGKYADSACTKEKLKKGVPAGKFEWEVIS